MSIKLHLLRCRLANFPEHLGAASDEQVEQFHQDLKVMKEGYQGSVIFYLNLHTIIVLSFVKT